MFHCGSPLDCSLAVLATWRITHLLASEDGPGDLIFLLRQKLGSSFFGRLMDCFYCLSLWVSAGVALFLTRDPAAWTLLWLALSGAACLLEQATRPSTVITETLEGDPHHALLRPETRQPETPEPNGADAGSYVGQTH